jgi:hypothetical protein
VRHFEAAGFSVTVREETDLQGIRTRLGVPGDHVSCHAAEADGYVIEGHVRAAAIRRLLKEARRRWRGGSGNARRGRRAWKAVSLKGTSSFLFGPSGRRNYMEFEGLQSVG